jgi:peptidoglycan/LPS O-acetylase OafA/YrhL
VVLHHCALSSPYYHPMQQTPFRILIAGTGAVLVFFVLSRTVLSLSFGSHDRSPLISFWARRIVRLWPPVVVALILAALLKGLSQPASPSGFSPWYGELWSKPTTLSSFFRQVLLTGTDTSLDGPIWSLVHEIRISLIFPVIVIAVSKWPRASVAATIFAMIPVRLVGLVDSSVLEHICKTASYLFLFVLGAAIALRIAELRAALLTVPRYLHAILWLVSIYLVSIAPPGNLSTSSTRMAVFTLISGLGASLMVALCVHKSVFTRVLERPLLSFFGKISFSLYLVHLPILIVSGRILPEAPAAS